MKRERERENEREGKVYNTLEKSVRAFHHASYPDDFLL